MRDHKPQKRHPVLQPASRDHHHTLLFCWKIREGIKRDVAFERMEKYAGWFWSTHLKPHFEIEEACIFSVLGDESILVRQAKAEHKRIKQLFEGELKSQNTLSQIEEELDRHIRFEERVLFNEIQKVATIEQMRIIEEHHHDAIPDDWKDEFWKRDL